MTYIRHFLFVPAILPQEIEVRAANSIPLSTS